MHRKVIRAKKALTSVIDVRPTELAPGKRHKNITQNGLAHHLAKALTAARHGSHIFPCHEHVFRWHPAKPGMLQI